MAHQLDRLGGKHVGRAWSHRTRGAVGWRSPVMVGLLVASVGCTGRISSSNGPSSGPGPSGTPKGSGGSVAGSGAATASTAGSGGAPGPVGPSGAGAGTAAGVADGSAFFPGSTQGATATRIWQLTPAQYITTISDALGVPLDLPRTLPTVREDHFLNDATALAVSDVSFANLEEDLRAALLTQQAAITSRLGCTVAALNADCAQTFLTGVATVAQGLATPNVAPALAVYNALAVKAGARAALDDAILAVLMSPSVMFRTELGPQDGTAAGMVSLTPAELSRALSYAITNGPPDATLRGHAADGTLANPDVFTAELNRLLASPRGQDGIKSFLVDWSGLASYGGLEKDLLLFPEFTPELKQAMLQETMTFIDYILRERGGSFYDLMTLQQSYVDPQEAGIYGLAATAPAGQMTTLPAGQRMGLFTQPAVLSMISDPALSGVIFRGKFVLDRLLCLSLSPPKDIVVEFPDFAALGLGPDSTVRQRLSTVENIAACAGCHKLMDPPGFALEHYDAIGRYRPDDQGKPIDASGALAFTSYTQAPFMDATEMFKTMASSPEVRACLTRQAFRYVFGRAETATDNPVLSKAYQQFVSSGNVGALVPQLVSSSAFALRERTAP